jgi:hypothetical protein
MEACRSVAGRNRPGTAGQLRVLPLGIADDSLDIHAEGSPSFGMAYPDAEHKAAWVVQQAWALVGMGRRWVATVLGPSREVLGTEIGLGSSVDAR